MPVVRSRFTDVAVVDEARAASVTWNGGTVIVAAFGSHVVNSIADMLSFLVAREGRGKVFASQGVSTGGQERHVLVARTLCVILGTSLIIVGIFTHVAVVNGTAGCTK